MHITTHSYSIGMSCYNNEKNITTATSAVAAAIAIDSSVVWTVYSRSPFL